MGKENQKQKMAKTTTGGIPNGLIVAVLLVVLVAGGVGALYFVMSIDELGKKTASITGTDTDDGNSGYLKTCEQGTAVTISVTSRDAMQPGTQNNGTYYVRKNGGKYVASVTSAAVDDNLDIYFQNGSTYHNAYMPGIKLDDCKASKAFVLDAYKNSSLTISLYNEDDTATLTDGGGANNMTLASGESATLRLKLQAQNLMSTQKMRCVLESSNTTKMYTMKLEGLGAVSAAKPSFYTVAATSSATWAFDIDPVTGSKPVEGWVYIEPKTNQDLSGSYIILDCYTYEYFLDSSTDQVGFGVEDSLGSAKYAMRAKGTYYID